MALTTLTTKEQVDQFLATPGDCILAVSKNHHFGQAFLGILLPIAKIDPTLAKKVHLTCPSSKSHAIFLQHGQVVSKVEVTGIPLLFHLADHFHDVGYTAHCVLPTPVCRGTKWFHLHVDALYTIPKFAHANEHSQALQTILSNPLVLQNACIHFQPSLPEPILQLPNGKNWVGAAAIATHLCLRKLMEKIEAP